MIEAETQTSDNAQYFHQFIEIPRRLSDWGNIPFWEGYHHEQLYAKCVSRLYSGGFLRLCRRQILDVGTFPWRFVQSGLSGDRQRICAFFQLDF